MKREILFRGKRVDNEEWEYGSLIQNGEFDCAIYDCNTHDDFYGVEVIPETIGQLWIPSNRIKVFGGDLVTSICKPCLDKTSKKKRVCKIIDTDKGFDISVMHNGEWWAYGFMDFSSIEVIGNIHDNPINL